MVCLVRLRRKSCLGCSVSVTIHYEGKRPLLELLPECSESSHICWPYVCLFSYCSLFNFRFIYFYKYEFFACIYVHVLCVYLVPTEVRRRIGSSGSQGWLWAIMWVLRTELRSSARTASTLIHRAISPTFLSFCFETRSYCVFLKFGALPASVSWVLWLKVWTTMFSSFFIFIWKGFELFVGACFQFQRVSPLWWGTWRQVGRQVWGWRNNWEL